MAHKEIKMLLHMGLAINMREEESSTYVQSIVGSWGYKLPEKTLFPFSLTIKIWSVFSEEIN